MTRAMIAVYLVSIVLANVLATHAGAPGSVVIAFLFIGLDMQAKDTLQARWGLSLRTFALIVLGGALSLPFGARRVALASCAAFLVSGIVDAIVFHVVTKNKALRSNEKNRASIIPQNVF